MKTILLLILIIIILLVIYVVVNTYYVTINTVDISATFEGVLKIAHISDIHGNQINLPYIRNIINGYSNFHVGIKKINKRTGE